MEKTTLRRIEIKSASIESSKRDFTTMETPQTPPEPPPEPVGSTPQPPLPPPSSTPPPVPPVEPPLLEQGPTQLERTWAMASHLSAFAGHFIPFGHIFGPLIIWLLKRDSSEFVADQAKEALNAQISFTIYAAVAVVLILIIIGLPLLVLIWLADIILVIVAAVTANDGTRYRYPLILRLVT